MCGRFAIDISKPAFQKRFHIEQLEIQLAPHYNVSPGMLLPTIIHTSPKRVMLMKWGFIPHWSKTPTVKFMNINARAETITTSPAYRFAFEKQRCLIPAIGFYEWAKLEDGTKQPYFFKLTTQPVFAFAGIWDTWRDAEGKEFNTCAMITTEANGVVGKIHPRMPVILKEADEESWLSEKSESSLRMKLLRPYVDSSMVGYRVSTQVNNARIDDKRLIEQNSSIA